MPISIKLMTTTLLTTAIAGAVMAAGHISEDAQKAMNARQAHMQLYSFNLGTIGAMAQEKAPYDAEAAAAAANNLAALAQMSQHGYWVEGTDSSIEESRAKAEIWTDMAGFEGKAEALATASVNLAAVAGDGLDALKGAFGPVGGGCGGCHDDYRAPRN